MGCASPELAAHRRQCRCLRCRRPHSAVSDLKGAMGRTNREAARRLERRGKRGRGLVVLRRSIQPICFLVPYVREEKNRSVLSAISRTVGDVGTGVTLKTKARIVSSRPNVPSSYTFLYIRRRRVPCGALAPRRVRRLVFGRLAVPGRASGTTVRTRTVTADATRAAAERRRTALSRHIRSRCSRHGS